MGLVLVNPKGEAAADEARGAEGEIFLMLSDEQGQVRRVPLTSFLGMLDERYGPRAKSEG
jgi:hypothetical protein